MVNEPVKRIKSGAATRKYPKVKHPDSYVQSVGIAEDARASLARWWDDTYPGGEGELQERGPGGVKRYCRWVSIVAPGGNSLGVLLLFSDDAGECYRMEVAKQRAPLLPNPYDPARVSKLPWDARKMGAGYVAPSVRVSDDGAYTPPAIANPARPEDVRPHDGDTGELDYNADPRTKAVFADGQIQGGIVPLPTVGGDTRFQFRAGDDGFTVRGSKLAPVLLKLREAGVQEVTLPLLQKALSHAG